uniref:Uncharacterized protein n=1 Tax=Anopheles melas TaxID=34690 RepID=A0A182UBH2_9DIPT
MEREREHGNSGGGSGATERRKHSKKRSKKSSKKSKRKRHATTSDVDDLSSGSFGEESKRYSRTHKEAYDDSSGGMEGDLAERTALSGSKSGVEYSDVSSDDFSAPEAGEIETDATDTAEGGGAIAGNGGDAFISGNETDEMGRAKKSSSKSRHGHRHHRRRKSVTDAHSKTRSHRSSSKRWSQTPHGAETAVRSGTPSFPETGETNRTGTALEGKGAVAASSISSSSSRSKRINSVSSDTSSMKYRRQKRRSKQTNDEDEVQSTLVDEHDVLAKNKDDEQGADGKRTEVPDGNGGSETEELDDDNEEDEEEEEEDDLNNDNEGQPVSSRKRIKKSRKDKKHKRSKKLKKRKKKYRTKSISSIETISESEGSLLESMTPPLKQSPGYRAGSGEGSKSYTPVHNDTSLTPVSPGSETKRHDNVRSIAMNN